MKKITNRQEQILTFIRVYHEEHGYTPTIREICSHLELSSPATVHSHLARLKQKGLITYQPYQSRTIKLIQVEEVE